MKNLDEHLYNRLFIKINNDKKVLITFAESYNADVRHGHK